MKILAVDFGDARTGLACCDRTEFLASPIGVIQERKFENVVQQVAYAAVEYEAGEIVVGHPLNMNGSAGPRAKLCEAFAEALSEKVSVPVAATIILESYLNYRRNHPETAGGGAAP